MDLVAEKVNMNPADFLLKNVMTTTGVGADVDFPNWDISHNPMPQMLQKTIAESNWRNRWKGWGNPLSVDGSKYRGLGIAVHACRHGALVNPQSAAIMAQPTGTFYLNCGSQDVGQGSRTSLAIMAAEELGVPFEKVYMPQVDTAVHQESRSPGGSTVTRGSGTAIILAARDMKEQLFKLAIEDKRIAANSPDELETEDDHIYLKAEPATRVPIATVTARMNAVSGPLIGRGSYATKRQGWMHRQWSNCVVEVEVDIDTGEVKVIEIWHYTDIGRTIWHQGSVNQCWGAITEAIGRTLFEGLYKDEGTGITLNPNYLDYKIPSHADRPKMNIYFHEEIANYAPFGAVGIAEPQVGCVGPAVANAIYNAVGARVFSTPITPMKILAALGKA